MHIVSSRIIALVKQIVEAVQIVLLKTQIMQTMNLVTHTHTHTDYLPLLDGGDGLYLVYLTNFVFLNI